MSAKRVEEKREEKFCLLIIVTLLDNSVDGCASNATQLSEWPGITKQDYKD